MTYDEVKNAPLNVLVGYLASFVADEDDACICCCKTETWTCDGHEYEEAIQIAKVDEDICKRKEQFQTCPARHAYERVMDAMKKQMPLKVTNMYRCPNCGLDPTIDNDYMLNYCSHCGQALDWSIMNETLA